MISIITDPGTGGTFLTWSIYYLSGRTSYFSVQHSSTVPLTEQPLNKKNAHNFVANQPLSLDEFNSSFSLLLESVHNECIYLHQFAENNISTAIHKISEHNTKNIVVAMSANQVLYQCKYEPRSIAQPAWNTKQILTSPDDIYEDFVNHFFKDSKQVWDKENLNEVWDKREFIALNIDPFKHNSIIDSLDASLLFFHLNAVDLWTNFDQTIHELFEYIELPLDQDRYHKWIVVYHQWKLIHQNRLRFVWYFDTIINYILTGVDFDLERFDLDIRQEAAIQHTLIYKHGLNLKTWQLTKFKNTKQLHNLLESNFHDLSLSLLRCA